MEFDTKNDTFKTVAQTVEQEDAEAKGPTVNINLVDDRYKEGVIEV